MAPMVLIGKFYNTFYNIVTTDLISVHKNNIVFKGIQCDLDEGEILENGIFWRISFII